MRKRAWRDLLGLALTLNLRTFQAGVTLQGVHFKGPVVRVPYNFGDLKPKCKPTTDDVLRMRCLTRCHQMSYCRSRVVRKGFRNMGDTWESITLAIILQFKRICRLGDGSWIPGN